MKRLAGLVVVPLCFWLCGSIALATCHVKEGKATVSIEVGPYSFGYLNKDDEPIPCVLRGKVIEIKITWLPGSQDGQGVIFSDFRALKYEDTNDLWKEDEPREIRDSSDSSAVRSIRKVRIDYPDTEALILLPSKPGLKERRLIIFTVELITADGKWVQFDPPWAERP